MKKKIYESPIDQKKSALVFGYQGLNNIGDDLMFMTGFYNFLEIYSIKRPYRILNETHLSYFKYSIKLLLQNQLVFSGGNIFNIATKLSYIKLAFFMFLFFLERFFDISRALV